MFCYKNILLSYIYDLQVNLVTLFFTAKDSCDGIQSDKETQRVTADRITKGTFSMSDISQTFIYSY